MLPPGFVIRQFGHTRDKLSTARIEQKISYADGTTFNETILFKAPNKYRVVISGNSGTVTFVRNGEKCIAVSSQKQLELQCRPLSSLFYHNLLLSNNELLIPYLKSLNITLREGVISIQKKEENGTYVKPDGIVMVDYKNKPVYLIGITDSLYKSAVSAVSGKNEINDAVIEELKYTAPQIWMEKNEFLPLRVFGKHNGDDLDISLTSYIKDGNEVPFPKSILLSSKDKGAPSFNVNIFESGVDIKDDVFTIDGLKKLQLEKQAEFSDTKNKIVGFLREYR